GPPNRSSARAMRCRVGRSPAMRKTAVRHGRRDGMGRGVGLRSGIDPVTGLVEETYNFRDRGAQAAKPSAPGSSGRSRANARGSTDAAIDPRGPRPVGRGNSGGPRVIPPDRKHAYAYDDLIASGKGK